MSKKEKSKFESTKKKAMNFIDRNKVKKKEEEEDNDKVLLIVLILFILLFAFLLFFSFFFHVSRPRITGGSDEWARKRLIKVEKDSRSRHKISHYVYCVSETKRMNKCTWEKTKTKNTVISKTGHYYVAFKGVDKRGKTSRRSNIEEVYIDNNNPIIEKVKLSATKSTITIKVDAKDKESGVDKYYFSLDGKNYKEGSSKYTFKKLNINRDYNLYVKVVDRVGNETIYQTKTNIKTIIENAGNDKNNSTTDKNNDKNNPDKDNDEDDDKANGSENNNGTDNGNNDNENSGNGGDNGNEDNNVDNKPEKEWDIPIINLDKVPAEFPIGSNYKLPSYYSFGNDTGVVSCVVKGVEYTDTTKLGIGNHLITCRATSSHNKSVQVQKNVTVKVAEGEDEIWDGWIKLNLYYPDNSTNWQWRLGREDEIRDGYEDDGWQDYTGPILVKITDVENVYIRYDLNGETVIIPPTGKIVVDIEPESYSLEGDAITTVKITYDKDATVKEYKVGNKPWKEYTEPFTVSKNTLIEARASKKEDVYDNKGNKLYSQTVTGTDSVFVGELNPSKGEKPPVEGGGDGEEEKPPVEGGGDGEGEKPPVEGGGDGEGEKPPVEGGGDGEGEKPPVEGGGDGEGEKPPVEGGGDGEGEKPPVEGGGDGEELPPGEGTAPGGSDGDFEYKPIEKPDGGGTITVPDPDTKPSTYLEGPSININPETITEEVEVSITTEEEARDIYYKIGNGKYQKYTSSFKLNTNSIIRSYYVRKSDGKVSKTSVRRIKNIKVPNLPYVRIDAEPDYLTQNVNEVKVTISGSDYNKLEYSYDGISYIQYTEPLIITDSRRIYARGTNDYGEKIEVLDITTINPPPKKEKLMVKITATPETSDELIGKTTVTIDYDPKAEKKYYQIDDGEVIEYTAPFELTKNSSIRAYATSENGYGSAFKTIDFLTEGIASPEIIISPGKNTPTPQVKVTIIYDKNATTKQYKVGEGNYYEYNGPFYVDMNTTIYAYNKNSLEQEKESSLKIENIVSEPPYLVLDKGMYFLIKLNYPTQAKTKEYKWKVDGEWKPYPSDGILLIKPEYKDKVLSDAGVKIKIENENGELIDFNGDYYLIDVPLNELSENIFLRWDIVKPEAPTIIVNPTEYTKSVLAVIMYPDLIKNKLYKIVTEDGKDSGWKEYTTGIEITQNNTVIYAKGYTRNEVESEIASFKVENIDLEKPTVTAIGDFTTNKQKVNFQVAADDNSKVITRVSWAQGKKDLAYFKDNGNNIPNRYQVTAEENGFYTIYAEDQAGNTAIKVIEVTNVDKDAPNIIINVLTKEYSSKVKVKIDYGDSKVKEYRIGKNSTTYEEYTDILEISSLDVLDKVNEDGSLSIFAKGTDEAGNSVEVEEKIYNLDFDTPEPPIIVTGAGYPILTINGIKIGSDSYINFDKRNDIENFYSIDKGETWNKYTGPFSIASGEIWAKSVKQNSGLEIITKKTVKIPSDALDPNAYDGNEGTCVVLPPSKNLLVSKEMWGSRFFATGSGSYGAHIYFFDKDDAIVEDTSFGSPARDLIAEIPSNTYKMSIRSIVSGYQASVCEIRTYNVPNIKVAQKPYPKLTEYGVDAYNEITIDYFPTSVERLYKINSGNWQIYQDKSIKLKAGDTIEAKAIDKNGNETEVSTYTAVVPDDALGPTAYDGDSKTGYNWKRTYPNNRILNVSEEMQGRNYYVTYYYYCYSSPSGHIQYFDNSGKIILDEEIRGNSSKKFTIPANTAYISFVTGAHTYDWTTIYEIVPATTPVIKETKQYPILTESGVSPEYNEVTIDYFQTSVERLYRINSGAWKDYRDKPIRLEIGDIIESKAIDKYGKESEIATYTATVPSDSLDLTAYDGNSTTYVRWAGIGAERKIKVSEEMQGKNYYLNAYWGHDYGNYCGAIKYIDENEQIIDELAVCYSNKSFNKSLIIPDKTTYIKFMTGTYSSSESITIYEIDASSQPAIIPTKVYPELSKNSFSSAKNKIKINYPSYLITQTYSLDEGKTWNNYSHSFTVDIGTKILAKGITPEDKDSELATYTVPAITDSLDPKMFDKDIGTVGTIRANQQKIFTLADDTVGQRLRIFTTNTVGTSYLTIYDKTGTQVDKVNLTNQITTLKIKDNYYKVVITAGSSNLNISEVNLRPEQNAIKNNPLIEVSDVIWNTSKGITITYPDWEYTNEYSLDNGLTWNEYVDSFTITKNTTIMARSISDGKLIGSSSFAVTKIDTVEPTIELNIPDTIVVGTDYKLPTSYIVGASGGTPICKVGDIEYTSTKDLEVGTHIIDCSITNGVGKKRNINKTVVVELTIDANDLISKANDSSITSYENGNKGEMYTFNHEATTQTAALTDYRYIGNVPNNYIVFNDETWRIIGVFDGKIKIIRENSIGNYQWDDSGSNEWTTSSLKSLLNSGAYYTSLSAVSKLQIDTAKYYLGGGVYSETTHYGNGNDIYKFERGTNVYNSRSVNWDGQVGLMYPSDYIYTFAYNVENDCFNDANVCNLSKAPTSWLHTNSYHQWTISSFSDYGDYAFMINDDGYVDTRDHVGSTRGIRPVVYLKSNILLKGAGTSTQPYVIVSLTDSFW